MDALLALALRQHGCLSRGQFLRLRSQSTLDRWLAAKRLVPLYPGVYVLSEYELTERGRLSAALLYCGKGAQLSHATATYLHGFFASAPEVIHVLVAHERTVDPQPGIRVHRTRMLRPPVSVDGLASSDVVRTVVDMRALMRWSDWRRLASDLVSRRLATPAQLVEAMDEVSGRPGTDRGRRFAMTLDERHGSPPEADLARLLARSDLPAAVPQYEIETPSGRFRADFAFAAQRLIVEVDGYRYHSSIGQVDHDDQRQEALEKTGWRVIRVSPYAIRHRPKEVLERIALALALTV